MSTGTIIAIVVIALIILAVIAFVVPRMRANSRERQIARRREEVAGAHREVAEERMTRAEQAERVARAERAEAEMHASRADLHEQGLADDELDDDHRRFVRDGNAADDDTIAADETRRTKP
jgi:multidrug efflux pump subunit AcrA (membrane-fusion protein)